MSDTAVDYFETGVTGGHKPLSHLLDEDGTRLCTPRIFSLSTNTRDALDFIEKLNNGLRELGKSRHLPGQLYTFDFTKTKTLHVDAALITAATIDYWERRRGLTFHRYREKSWNSDVRKQFSILQIDDPISPGKMRLRVDEGGKKLIVPLFTGRNLKSSFLEHTCKKIDRHIKEDNSDFKKFFYNGLVEAITNVVHHAYRATSKNRVLASQRWWAVGALWKHKPRLIVGFCDLGRGFRASLEDSMLRSAIEKNYGKLESLSDDKLIYAAMKSSDDRLGEGGRGNGLREIMRITREVEGAKLRIWSGWGCVSYKDGELKAQHLVGHFSGTAILWDLHLSSSKKAKAETKKEFNT